MSSTPSFGDDLRFLRRHVEVEELSSRNGRARVAVSSTLQGRVLTTSGDGESGVSLGWVNRDLIRSGRIDPQGNLFGGEDRLLLGPEFGPFSIYFPPGSPDDLKRYAVPAGFDHEPFEVVRRRRDAIVLKKRTTLLNRAGTLFRLEIWRTIRLLPAEGPKGVSFESENRIVNRGRAAWRPETGLLSLWVLGAFPASPEATVVLPGRGPVNLYFGPIPPERLAAGPRAIFFRGDGRARGKIGLPHGQCRSVLGSYDPSRGVLTVVRFSRPRRPAPYVSSIPGVPGGPYAGDAVNAYNHEGSTFYELESSSPALALRPGASARHVHRTGHFSGSPRALGVSIEELRRAFPRR